MGIRTSLALAAAAAVVAIAPAQASTFIFEKSNAGGNTAVGQHSYIKTTYDDVSEVLTWSSTFTRNSNNGKLADGAWLVLSDGDNPKGDADEYAIFYLDGLTDKVSIYNYNGKNKNDSYIAETYLGSTALTVTNNGTNERTFEFSIDATAINSDPRFNPATWKGVGFAEQVGIWFHGVNDPTITYDANGLSEFSYTAGNSGWYDTSFKDTTRVPEPGSIAALGLFAATAVTGLRKRLG